MIDTSVFQGKKAAYYTLGCKLNFSETSTFGQMLEELGVTRAKKGEKADLCIINTCTVTETADSKSRQQIRKTIRNHPGAFVVVTGCYAQLNAEKAVEMPGVNLVLGSNEKARLIEYVSQWLEFRDGSSEHEDGGAGAAHCEVTKHTKDITTFQPSCSRGERTRFWLKVQDGCDNYCTYCTIPYARGNSRNPAISSLVKQAREAAASGGKEIVLTGVNIGDFGKTTGETFTDLVKALDGVEGIERYRISSLEPDLISDELIDYCAGSRAFMPHFHIPLQSGSDNVLRLMHRRYDTTFFRARIARIKEAMPDAFIGVDVMAGCRGETEDDFRATMELLQALPIAQLHVFPYSERRGTAALKIPYTVPEGEKHERVRKLMELSDQKRTCFYRSYINKERDVLLEKPTRGRVMHGFTDNYIRVEVAPPQTGGSPAGRTDTYDNKIVRVKITDISHDRTSTTAIIV